MAVRDDVVLVADGGDVTVGRQTASFVYGEFNVVLPHGRDQVETDDRLQDGYVYRPKGGIKGPFDVGFVRADVTVDLEADTSDLEVVVDAAQKQVEGDVFFERDISAAGLGQFVLDRDFRVGDVVTVELWGKRLRLPVTAGDYVASGSDGPVGVRVHVGGQLISDAEAVARQNGDLRRQIAREKAERQRQVSSESSARRSAVAGERSAREAAIEAEVSARKRGDEDEARNRQVALEAEERKRAADLKRIRDFLGGAGASDAALLSQLAAVNAQIIGMSDGKTQPAPGLLNSYMSLNTLLWEQQKVINDHTEKFKQQQKIIDRSQTGTMVVEDGKHAWSVDIGAGVHLKNNKILFVKSPSAYLNFRAVVFLSDWRSVLASVNQSAYSWTDTPVDRMTQIDRQHFGRFGEVKNGRNIIQTFEFSVDPGESSVSSVLVLIDKIPWNES